MNIKEIDKPEIKKVVVVYAGRFQPFHKGHYATYQKLVSKFGANNVYIGTSNDTSGPKSPFDFNEKKTIMNKMFGISPNKIVQVRNPYAPKEVLSGMDGKTTAYVAAVGEKDATRLAGKYFKPYKGKAGYGYDEIGYVYPVPAEDNAISGTDVRNWLSKGDDKAKQKGFTKAYPKFDKDIFNMITGKLNEELYKGYPSKEQVKDIERKNKEFRNSADSTSDDEYLYDPIAEILGRVAAEDIFEEFVKSYFKEETEAEKMGLTHLGGGYYGKEGQPASHKSDNGKIRTLTPQEVDAVKKKSMAKGPSDAPVNEPKPSQPGQPVNKGATAQGKVDKAKEEPTDKKTGGEKPGEQAPPPEQKLSGAELKSSAEMSDKDKGEQKVKETLDKAKKDLSKEDNESIDKVNNPQSQERKGAIGVLKKAASYIGHGIMHTLEHNKEMMVGTGRAIKSLATTGKMGSIKDKDGNNVHWDRYTEVGEKDFFGNEQPKMKEVPVYKTDSHGHAIKDKDGNKIQDTNLLGKLKTKKEPVYREGLSAEEKELAEKSWKESQRQKNGVKTLAKTTALIMGSIAVTGGLMGGGAAAMKGAGASGILKGAGAKIAAKFGGGHLGSYVMKDIIKHSAAEALGANAIQASGVGIALGAAGIFENKDGEEGFDTKKFVPNFMEKTLEIMQNYKLSDEQLIETLNQYKKEGTKNQSMANASDLMKEDISESKQQSIQHFVEFATKRLKLKETPNITLVGGREFAEVKTSLGGYNPDDKSIYVATEGRLTADILRTLAHEMAHRKQDEMGLVTNAETDGADGSPIENKAHAVAGILMREYGRINKQIYNEDINVDVDKGDTVLMGKFKNKKTTVKDIGTDDHGMPTINGKKATTFRIPRGEEEKSNPQSVFNEVGPNDWHFKAIMKMWDTANSFSRKKIGVVVCNNPKADRNDVARTLRNYGYKEVTHVTDKLGLEEKKNLNELTQGLFAGKVKIGGQPVEIEVELLGADNKTKEFITKIIHIDKKYQSKLPIGSEFKIPARIFRMPGGGWHKIKSSAFKESLNEGGAYGHMSHPFDDMDLTFGDLKKIIKGALTGNLELTREKTDGQALAISWKNGRLIAARNKSHLQNAGVGAMGIEDVASKFGGRGGLTDAYNFAMRDLTAAISGLSEAQRKKIFDEGKCFMNLEVIWPTSVNVIPYGQALLVFHNTTCYDEKGSAIGANQGAATMLAGMIKQVNADVQSKYTIQGPPVTELPKKEELSSKQTKYLTQLQKIQFQFQLSDKDGVSEYHQAWWEDFVNKSKVKLQKLEKEALVRRWAFGDKSFRLNTIADKDAQSWAIENDKVNVAKQQKDNVRQFEEIFLGVGADVLSFMGSVLTVNPDAAVRNMKDRLKSTAEKVRGSGDVSKIAKLKMELSRLASIGGKDKIVPNEGIVFVYKGNTYKLTGTFAPLNQILGIFYE
jgi:phosphopantetheine adenylyltransferase